MGFCVPSSRQQLVVSTCRMKHPASCYVPSSAFHPPSTVYSTTCLVGFFRPTTTSRVFPSGICPHHRAVPGLPRPPALLPFPPSHLPIRRRLQRDGPGFRALLPTMSVTNSGERLDPPGRHVPLGIFSPPGIGFQTVAAPSRSLHPRPSSRRALRKWSSASRRLATWSIWN
jgi:hypothetical protein